MNTAEYFDRNGYVVLKDAITKEVAAQLTEHMFTLHREGKLVKDEQCPLSDAIYGDPVFDNLMLQFAEPLGKAVGRRLLPTYTYARIYRPGDVLKKHKDRPACEISTTLTLGYDAGAIWPIYFDEHKEIPVDLDIGEMAAYKGCEMLHWREPFKGKWHVQVFLHFVDADGPYANEALDGRKDVGIDKRVENLRERPVQQPQPQQNELAIRPAIHEATFIPGNRETTLPGYFPINSENLPELMFTPEECDKIISFTKDAYSSAASVGGNRDNSKIAREIRSAQIYSLPNNSTYRWVYDKIAKIVSVANTVHFDYEISGIIHTLQLIHYPSDAEVKGHYNWHVDAGNGDVATRKISFTAQLSDPNSYTGCDLMVDDHCNKVQATRERGSISLFPSYMPHIVTPIETGDRYALVIWINGSRRFR